MSTACPTFILNLPKPTCHICPTINPQPSCPYPMVHSNATMLFVQSLSLFDTSFMTFAGLCLALPGCVCVSEWPAGSSRKGKASFLHVTPQWLAPRKSIPLFSCSIELSKCAPWVPPFTHSLTLSRNKYLLSNYCIPGTVLGPGNTTGKQAIKMPIHVEFTLTAIMY